MSSRTEGTAASNDGPSPDARRARAERRAWLAWGLVAAVGALYGLWTLWFHLTTDPLADVHAYYEAATRLNHGLPLYPATADPNAPEYYRYPPLLAIAFRPLALLPFDVAAAIWAAACLVTFALTLHRLGLRRREVWIAVGVLGMPIAWSLAVGQAQVPVTWLLALGSPAAVALAANLKVLPALVAIYWVARRDWSSLLHFAGWMAALVGLQLVLEPANTLAFLQVTNLSEVGDVKNLSPYAISPALWFALVVVLAVAAVRLGRTRWGWGAAVALSAFAPPRLLAYMFMSLLAALAGPRDPDLESERPGSSAAEAARDRQDHEERAEEHRDGDGGPDDVVEPPARDVPRRERHRRAAAGEDCADEESQRHARYDDDGDSRERLVLEPHEAASEKERHHGDAGPEEEGGGQARMPVRVRPGQDDDPQRGEADERDANDRHDFHPHTLGTVVNTIDRGLAGTAVTPPHLAPGIPQQPREP